MSDRPIPIHACSFEGSWREPEPPWADLGLQPRWRGQETSDCAAALNPTVFSNHGADELKRFIAGARSRDEVAIAVCEIGQDAEDDWRNRRGPRGVDKSFLLLPGMADGGLTAADMPDGVTAHLAPNLSHADADLGKRLQAHAGPWFAIKPGGITVPFTGQGTAPRENDHLQPILMDNLGNTVVAVWVSEDERLRWYILPTGVPWTPVLQWLVAQALPAYAPGALRRARRELGVDPELQTASESATRAALAELEADYIEQRGRLEEELNRVVEAADEIRYGLLFGAGDVLKDAVAAVLAAAGFEVTDLDDELGDTISADLLVEYDGRRWLIEVKSSSGSAPEKHVGDLLRHIETWPQIDGDRPIEGGALISNHNHKADPSQRPRAVYSRPEFVASLTVPAISSREIFDAWRQEDFAKLRTLVTGDTA